MKPSGALGCIIYIIILLAVILGIMFLVLQCGGNSCIREIDKSLPDIKEVPWEVTTPTHLYFAVSVEDDGRFVTLTDCYEQIEGDWVKRGKPLPLDRNIYGRIDVKRR